MSASASTSISTSVSISMSTSVSTSMSTSASMSTSTSASNSPAPVIFDSICAKNVEIIDNIIPPINKPKQMLNSIS